VNQLNKWYDGVREPWRMLLMVSVILVSLVITKWIEIDTRVVLVGLLAMAGAMRLPWIARRRI
jgi:hypothetical protein